jgi:hypothetical protein
MLGARPASTDTRIGDSTHVLHALADFDFDEVEIVNNHPMNVWLYAKCRTYVDPDEPEDEQVTEAEVAVAGPYDDNPTGI